MHIYYINIYLCYIIFYIYKYWRENEQKCNAYYEISKKEILVSLYPFLVMDFT